jgi:predicted amidophosphoribosyltransferase
MICRVCEKKIGTYDSIGICWQCYKEEDNDKEDYKEIREYENDKI